MQFEPNHIYHIFNQGNNRQKIFFERENYLFFLRKVRKHLLPYSNVLAYCLMPNHFHLMVQVNRVVNETGGATPRRSPSGQTLQQSIGVLLASYTRAINNQQNTTGSLFRKKTKAECLTCPNIKELSFCKSTGTRLRIDLNEYYLQTCFDYIHQNPVKAGLVKNPHHWEFSSAPDYAGVRKGSLVNRNLADELGVTF